MSIYIVHRRETSNALNASVRCEQKRLQRLSETVPANNRIPQAVRQGIPDRRTSHTESPSTQEIYAEIQCIWKCRSSITPTYALTSSLSTDCESKQKKVVSFDRDGNQTEPEPN